MFVPSYAPPPIEIPDNVAEERYTVRLGFVRRTLNCFLGAIAFATGIAFAPIDLPISSTFAATVAILVSMSLVRHVAKGRRMELVISAGMLLPFLVAAGLLARGLALEGWPLWPFAVSVAWVWVYGHVCRHDLSFIAMFVLPAIASLLVWIVADLVGGVHGAFRFYGPLVNLGFLVYLVYDLSALLTRRRLGEEWGATSDLFRDFLNFITYGWRVRSHWRRHPIWQR